MNLKLFINRKLYTVPLTQKSISQEELKSFTDDVKLMGDVVKAPDIVDTPGKLEIKDVKYTVFQGAGKLESKVPKSTKIVYETHHGDNKQESFKLTFTTDPVAFSEEESTSLVQILRKLATYSHTHDPKHDPDPEQVGQTKTYNTNDYYCEYCSHCVANQYDVNWCDNDTKW